MRPFTRIVLLAVLVAVTPVLVACEDFDMDKFDVFGLNKKKLLPGKREAVFPNGVPGVTQGIPPEYMKGYQEKQQKEAAAAAQAAAEAEKEKKAKVEAAAKARAAAEARAKARKRRHVVKRKPKPKPAPQPASQQAQQAPWPAGQPAPANQAGWPAQHSSSNSSSSKARPGRRRRGPAPSRADRNAVMRGLDPRIHLANTSSHVTDGLPGHVYGRAGPTGPAKGRPDGKLRPDPVARQ